jgi:hypothetical protein
MQFEEIDRNLGIDETPGVIEGGRQIALTIFAGLPGCGGLVRILDVIESKQELGEVKAQLASIFKEIALLNGKITDLQVANIIKTIEAVAPNPQVRKPEYCFKIMRQMSLLSIHGQTWDPMISIEEMAELFGESNQIKSDNLIRMVSHELDLYGWIYKRTAANYRLGFGAIGPRPLFFGATDQVFQDWNPAIDAKEELKKVIEAGETSINFAKMEKEGLWKARRLNAMISFMEMGGLIKETHQIGGMDLIAPYAILDDEAYHFAE